MAKGKKKVGEVLEDAADAVLGLERRGFPHSLADSTCDPFDYECGLVDGTRIRFHESHISPDGDWVHIDDVMTYVSGLGTILKDEDNSAHSQRFDRGIDIRVSSIIWCCKAPHGS